MVVLYNDGLGVFDHVHCFHNLKIDFVVLVLDSSRLFLFRAFSCFPCYSFRLFNLDLWFIHSYPERLSQLLPPLLVLGWLVLLLSRLDFS